MVAVGQADLASFLSIRSRQAEVKNVLETAGKELSTGQKSDLVKASGGDLRKLFGIENKLATLETESSALSLASGKATLAQVSLGRVSETVKGFGAELLSAVNRNDQQTMGMLAADAKTKLSETIDTLNVRYGRHHIFSGAAVDVPPLASADTIISDVSTIVASAPDAAAAITLIDDYFFDPAGGFSTGVYNGATIDAPTFVSEGGVSIDYSVRADKDEIRETLRALAIAATASSNVDPKAMLSEAGLSSIRAGDAVVRVQEKLGFAEQNIASTQAKNNAMENVFSLEKNKITAADPFETAAKFEALQGQLQTIYTVTARLSSLSLTNFLR